MERSNSSWFRWRRKKAKEGQGQREGREEKQVVVDGSEIRELVEDREAFEMLVDTKFRQLDADGDGRLSVRDLRPAVDDIGAALGLPAEGASPNTDHIYKEVVSELTHGTSQGEVSKAEFQEALSDILLGMAAGLKRDPIVILRMDGEDLRDFVAGARYESGAAAIFSQVGSAEDASLRRCLLAALQQLTVDHGVPPASDAWVTKNVVEPALQQLPADQLERPAASQDDFFQQLKELLGAIADRLREQPVIVAHTENNFDGSGVRRLLGNKFELDKLLDSVWKGARSEGKNKASMECVRAALDKMTDATSLPHYGAVKQVDEVVDEAIKMANADDGKTVGEAEFKKLLADILGAVMLQLSGNPIFVSTNIVVQEPSE